MKKYWVLIVGVLGLTALAFFLFRHSESADRVGKGAQVSGPSKSAPAPVRSRTDLRAADVDTLVADDRIGNIRLEGQVVDSDEEPVANAEVTISSNPRRTVVTEEDGSFFFDKLVGRTYSLVATSDVGAAGPVTTQLSEKSEPVILHLRPAATIEVRVLSSADRAALVGATVELRGLMSRTATANESGIAVFGGVAPGFYRVAAHAPGFATAQSPQQIGAVESTFKTELLLREGMAVSGVVRNEKGEGVEGAQVLYQSSSERWMRADPRFDGVLSGKDGAFSFPALPAGTFRFVARHSTYAPGESEPVTLTAGAAQTGIEISLEAGAVLAGRVVDENGEPAPLAAVRLSTDGGGRRRGSRPQQVYTADDGTFEITGLPKKAVSVVALHEQATSETYSADLSQKAEQRDVELVLSLSGMIAGTVFDTNGEPVDGAQVRLLPDFRARDFSFADLQLRGMAQGTTDSGGYFEFGGLDEGSYRVMATPPGSQAQFRGPPRGDQDDSIEAQVGDTNVRVVLKARGKIVGKVAFGDGSAVTTFSIGMGGFRGRSTPFASGDGSFELGDLEPGTYRPRLSGPDFDQGSIPEAEVKAGETVDLGTITVARGRQIRGRVVDGSGQGVVNATVIAGARLRGSGASATGGGFRGGSAEKSATTDDNGEFALRGLGSTTLVIVAEHETAGRSAAISLPASAESTDGLQLTLLAPSALEGVVTVDGEPADAARVMAQSQTVPSANYSVRSGADGRYRFDVLAADRYKVSVEVGGFRTGRASASEELAIEAGTVATLDLSLSLGTITLKVTPDAEGFNFGFVDVIGAVVKASNAQQLETAKANVSSTFSSGAPLIAGEPALIEKVQPGDYTVCVTVFPAELEGREAFGYLGTHAADVPVFCKAVTVAAQPAEQDVVIPARVPALIED